MNVAKEDNLCLVLSPTTPDDQSFMAEVLKSVIPQYDPIMPGAFQKWAAQMESGPLPDCIKTSLIIKKNEKLGFLGTVQITKDVEYLMMLYFLPQYQHKGYGQTVLHLLINKLKHRHVSNLILLVNQQADWAVNFYRKENFQVISQNQEEIENYCEAKMKPFYVPSTMLMGKTI
jgi:ribosomal protein S18 acetylase RimI-like enzyme